jgi:hypothetical protein
LDVAFADERARVLSEREEVIVINPVLEEVLLRVY